MVVVSKTIAMVWAAALTAVLAGCGGSDDVPAHSSGAMADPGTPLAQFVQDAQAEVPKLIELFDELYSDIRILGESDDTLIYEYDFKEQVDPGQAIAGLETQTSLLDEACEAQGFPIMISLGIPDPKVRYAYFNADGSFVWSHTCTSS